MSFLFELSSGTNLKQAMIDENYQPVIIELENWLEGIHKESGQIEDDLNEIWHELARVDFFSKSTYSFEEILYANCHCMKPGVWDRILECYPSVKDYAENVE